MIDIDKLPGMKQTEFKPCLLCGQGVMHDAQLTFYRLRIEHYCIDPRAVQRQAGLEMMMGGNARLANIMGPDADLAKRVGKPLQFLVCQQCAIERDDPVAALVEIAGDKEGK